MPNDVITLVPSVGDSLALSGSNYALGMEVDWGEHVIDPQLASGSDVVGGVPGVRRREPAEASIPVRVHATEASDYLSAAEALASAATALARHGGTVTHQVDFGDDELSVELQSIVYACNLDPEAGWLEAHRKDAVVVLNITRDPTWTETAAETLATQTSQSGGVITTGFTARGNLPGPAVFECSNPISTDRRYWEVGGAVTQYQAADSYHYTGGQFTAGAASLGSDADSIDTSSGTLQLTTVVPALQELGRLTDLTNIGTYNVKVRVKGSNDTAQQFVRVLFRQSGGGPWREVGTATVPGDASQYWMVEVGTLRNYLASTDPGTDTIDIRVDAYADDTGGPTLSLDSLFLIPAEIHTVARGLTIIQPPTALSLFDGFSDEETPDEAVSGTTAPSGGAWSIQGDTDPDWLARGAPFGGIRREGANDSSSALSLGQFLVLGTSPTNNYTNVSATLDNGIVKHKGAVATQTILGLAVRFTLNNGGGNNTPNCLLLACRARRRSDGKYKIMFSLYKFTGTGATPTVTKIRDLDQADGRSLNTEHMRLIVDTSGNWTAQFQTEVRIGGNDWDFGLTKTGTDSALATAGSLETGRVALYSYIESDNEAYAFTEVGSISGSASASTPIQADVIRGSGTGRIVHYGAGAYSDDDAGGDEVQVPSVTGARLYLPPGQGELVSIIRRGDSQVEPDTGHGDNNDLTLTHYPAYATLPDAIQQDYEQLILSDTPSLYWRLGASGITDLSGNGRNGTAQGGVTIGGTSGAISGDADTATDFDGSNDYVSSSYNPFTNATARTYEGWAWRDTSSSNDTLWAGNLGGANAEPAMYLASGGNDVAFWPARGGTSSVWSSGWPGNAQWVYWVLVFDESANTASLYINGVLDSTEANSTAYSGDSPSINLAQNNVLGGTYPFDGKIDEFAIYERALTPTEILSHYNKGAG